jgi:hypothetical protein
VNPSKTKPEKRTNFNIFLIPENLSMTPSNTESMVFQEVEGMGLFSDFGRLSFMTTRCFAAGVVLSRSQHDMCIFW